MRFLQAGWSVRGTLRNLDRVAEVRKALAPHLTEAALARLSFAVADLNEDAGWNDTLLASAEWLASKKAV